MESDLIAWLSLAAVLLLMSGAAAAEVALASADRADLRRKAESGDAASARAEALLKSPARLLLTTTVVKNLGMVSVGGLLLFVLSDELPLSQVALLLLLVGLVVSTLQLVVRRVVSRGAIAVALRAAPFVQLLALLLTPLFYLLHRFGIDIDDDEGSTSDESVFLSEEGLRHLIDVNDESAELEDSEREMIAGILEMDETVVREVMKPRVDMVSLPVDTTLHHALDVIIAAGHSRIPVYEDDLDLIAGVLYAKDLLRCFRDQQTDVAIRDILRPAYFVPVSKRVDDLLREMQSQRVHIAIVVDEYGGTAGLVTVEDILEEIVGEIRDEYDVREESFWRIAGDDVFVFNSRLDMDTVEKLLGADLTDADTDTLGGLIYSELGHVPIAGESVYLNDWVLTVLSIHGRRIHEVQAERVRLPAHDELPVIAEKQANGKPVSDNAEDGKTSSVTNHGSVLNPS